MKLTIETQVGEASPLPETVCVRVELVYGSRVFQDSKLRRLNQTVYSPSDGQIEQAIHKLREGDVPDWIIKLFQVCLVTTLSSYTEADEVAKEGG